MKSLESDLADEISSDDFWAVDDGAKKSDPAPSNEEFSLDDEDDDFDLQPITTSLGESQENGS